MKRGFTLVELLVVIAIIAILAGITFPGFASTREKARQASCQSNIRQLAMALAAYASDHEVYPHKNLWVQHGTEGVDVSAGAIWPYVNDKQAFACPSRGDMLGYGLNPYLGSKDPGSGTMLLAEVGSGAFLAPRYASTATSPCDVAPHFGGKNVAYCDGHVAVVRAGEMFELVSVFYNGD